jgi:hypothetical protein
MGRGLTRAASLIEGFNAMYDTIDRVQRDQELRKVASEVPTMDEGFTPEQGAQIQSAANSGQYDIEWDPESKGYKITPKAGGAPGMINMQQRQSFQGKILDKPLDEAGISRARQMAMAGVLERHGDLDGAARIRDRLAADEDRQFNRERLRKAAEREDVRWERDQKQYDAEQAYRDGMSALIDGSIFGQRSKAFQEQMAKYEADKKAYDAKVAAGEVGAIAPTPPQPPTMTSGEKMLDAAQAIAFKAQHGKASLEEIMKVSEQMSTLGQEGYLNMLRMAHAGAPLTAVVQAFNSTGKAQIDPSAIIKDERVKRPGGVESRLITYQLPDGRTQTIDTYADMAYLGRAEEALKQAQQEFQHQMQERQVAVSEGHLRVNQADATRRAAEFNAGASTREAAAEIARLKIALAKTEDPAEQQRIESKLRALSTGMRSSGAGADPAKVKEAQTVLAAGMAPDMASALELVLQNPEKVHQDFVKSAMQSLPGSPERAVQTADKLMEQIGWRRAGNRWTKVGGGQPAAGPGGVASFASEAEAAAAAAAGKIKPGDRITVNGRSGTWQ